MNSYVFDSTTDARHDVEPDDGDQLWRCVPYSGVLVLFKDHSIHLMLGDVDQTTFTWQVVSPKEVGIGAFAPFTVTPTPAGIFFGAQSGIYVYRPGAPLPVKISDPIHSSYTDGDTVRRLTWVGGWDPIERAYMIAYASGGPGGSDPWNDTCWAYYVDTGAWSTIEYAEVIEHYAVSSFGLLHNTSRQVMAFGSQAGYVFEIGTGQNDGLTSGWVDSGTVTGGTATILTDSGNTFPTTGLLTGLEVVVYRASTGLYQVSEINSATSHALTVTAWSSFTPAAGDKYYIGGFKSILSLGRLDFGTAGDKWVKSIWFEFQKQTHSVPVRLGYTVDGDAEPTTTSALLQSGGFRVEIPVERICVGISPYLSVYGNDCPVELLRIDVDWEPFMGDAQKSVST